MCDAAIEAAPARCPCTRCRVTFGSSSDDRPARPNPSQSAVEPERYRCRGTDCRGSGAPLAVGSTVAAPVLTHSIELGADLVVHSAGKCLNGVLRVKEHGALRPFRSRSVTRHDAGAKWP